MKRFYKAATVEGYQEVISEEDQLLNYLALAKISCSAGESIRHKTGKYESALVILSGTATITCEGMKWNQLGGRKTVFDGKATTVYVPCQSEYEIIADTDVEIAVCKVLADEKFEPFVVGPDEIVVHQRGQQTWQREVHDILADQAEGRVQRIVLGETFHHPGHWSGFPPHKHDGEHAPIEPHFEEIYHYQLNPEQGFGVQLHYTKDSSIDDAHIIKHGDSFAIDIGYHPVNAAGGYQLYYLWFMAGDSGRTLHPYEDPDHKWLHHSQAKSTS
ncbi:5-deoxy-glucuronate isomerase [Bacillus horti]|uniref:5-deoxy-glucuronate isomerase n=1 Tax=Caldalkalibacillus horti TaxID=77523 RepID=A0ABT9VWT7_9BACI|nr:5-deoxy-glucuronate isomerase [Bacillus horti]MDQ0165434.1 5-deoxy-glucuronate isomerase [Bacillus horti]